MSESDQITVSLPPELKRVVAERVQSGEFATASDAIAEAIRAWGRESAEDTRRVAVIRDKITAAMDDPRPSTPIGEAFERLGSYHETRQQRGS